MAAIAAAIYKYMSAASATYLVDFYSFRPPSRYTSFGSVLKQDFMLCVHWVKWLHWLLGVVSQPVHTFAAHPCSTHPSAVALASATILCWHASTHEKLQAVTCCRAFVW